MYIEDINIAEQMLKATRINKRGKREIRFEVNSNYFKAIENIINRNKELKNSLIDMVNQFAYEDNNPKTKGSSLEKLYTGGLSALENAFNTLNIDEGIEREQLWKLLQK